MTTKVRLILEDSFALPALERTAIAEKLHDELKAPVLQVLKDKVRYLIRNIDCVWRRDDAGVAGHHRACLGEDHPSSDPGAPGLLAQRIDCLRSCHSCLGRIPAAGISLSAGHGYAASAFRNTGR